MHTILSIIIIRVTKYEGKKDLRNIIIIFHY